MIRYGVGAAFLLRVYRKWLSPKDQREFKDCVNGYTQTRNEFEGGVNRTSSQSAQERLNDYKKGIEGFVRQAEKNKEGGESNQNNHNEK